MLFGKTIILAGALAAAALTSPPTAAAPQGIPAPPAFAPMPAFADGGLGPARPPTSQVGSRPRGAPL